LQVGWSVFFFIETAAVDMSRSPEQQIVMEIDKIVLCEDLPLHKSERPKRLLEDALGAVLAPCVKALSCNLVHGVGEALQQRRYFVFVIRNELYLLGPGSDWMITLPDDVSLNEQLCQRHPAVRIRQVQYRQPEPVVGPIPKRPG
jgi:hypothetical protein